MRPSRPNWCANRIKCFCFLTACTWNIFWNSILYNFSSNWAKKTGEKKELLRKSCAYKWRHFQPNPILRYMPLSFGNPLPLGGWRNLWTLSTTYINLWKSAAAAIDKLKSEQIEIRESQRSYYSRETVAASWKHCKNLGLGDQISL